MNALLARRRMPLFIGIFVASASLVVVAAACGGKEATTPGASSGALPNGSAIAASGGVQPVDTGSPSTTTALDASDLQGQKLTSSTHTEVETKGDGGPHGGGRSDEPGRRREDIRTIVLTHRDEARACYDKGLKDHPGIEGDLDIKWTIDPDGNVSNVSVDTMKSSITEETTAACVMAVIKKIKFAASAKGFETHASYPFNFHPRQTRRDGGAVP